MPLRTAYLVACSLWLWAACGGGGSGPQDAGPPDDGAADGSSATPPSPVASPVLTPCPPGWRLVPGTDDVPSLCDPWPESGMASCPLGEAHRPGEPGCTGVGDPCPADPMAFAADLPADAYVLYVRVGEAGDGTLSSPFGTVTAALARATSGAVVAIAPGLYEGRLLISASVTLWGTCTDVVIHGWRVGVAVSGADVELRNIRVGPTEVGVFTTDGSLRARGLVVDGSTDRSLLVSASTVDVEDASMSADGVGVSVVGSSTVTLRRAAFSDAQIQAFEVTGGEITVEDSVVRESTPAPGSLVLNGLGGMARLERVAAWELAEVGVSITDMTSVELVDTVLEGAPAAVGGEGPGVLAIDAALRLTRVRIDRARAVGLAAIRSAGSLVARDVVLRDTLPGGTAVSGHGLEVAEGASVDLERVLLLRSNGLGALVDGPSTVRAADLSVLDTDSDQGGRSGRGLQVQRGGALEAERILVRGNREVGIVSADLATVILLDAEIEGTRPPACVDDGCPAAGIGVGSYLEGSIRMERFRLSHHALIGAQVAREGQMDLVDGEVFDNPIGANVQVPGFDVARLSNRVYYRANGINLSSEEQVVPEPTTR